MIDEHEKSNVAPYDEIYGRDFQFKNNESRGWIQWKGTDACVDLYCACGAHGHIDAQFAYSVECARCGQQYAVGQNIKLIPLLTKAQINNFDTPLIFANEDAKEDADE